jgi:hypothetical protein
MSTVLTRIMHKLRVGNDAGRITTDERGQNVWQWSESADAGVTNNYGKKVNDDGGFNPYG